MIKVIIIMILLVFSGCSNKVVNTNTVDNVDNLPKITGFELLEPQIIGEDIPISRGLVAKMIALTFFEYEEIKKAPQVINFIDVEPANWSYSYINIVVSNGYMNGQGELFSPLEYLTLNEAQIMINTLNKNNKTNIKISDETKNQPISYALWIELFETAILENINSKSMFDSFEVYETDIVIFDISKDNSEIITNLGVFKFNGYFLDKYVGKKIKVKIKEDEIFSVSYIIEENPVIEDVYIKNVYDNVVTIFLNGSQKDIMCDFYIEEELVMDIVIYEDKIIQGEVVTQNFKDNVKKIYNGSIEFENLGAMSYDKNIKVYDDKWNLLEVGTLKNIIVGTANTQFFSENDIVTVAIVKNISNVSNMRVLISNPLSGGYYHDEVIVYSESDFNINSSNVDFNFSKNIDIVLDDNLFDDGRIYIDCDKLYIKSISDIPYYGDIEIEKTPYGYLIVNEINLEDYIKSVLASIIPHDLSKDVLMVQSILVRNTAYNQFFDNKYFYYGANVDDTENSQIYNKTLRSQTTDSAVLSTKNKYLTKNNYVISGKYYSTSSGMRANSGEIWADKINYTFPNETLEYLTFHNEYINDIDFGDLRIDENAHNFFKSTDIESYDAASGWFRWNILFTKDEIIETINNNMQNIYDKNKQFITIKDTDGNIVNSAFQPITEFNDIYVKRRGFAGNAMEIIIKSDNHEISVLTHQVICELLAPKIDGIEVICHNGINMGNYFILPSSFFTIEKFITSEGVDSVTIYGGGRGHGVGFSQQGGEALAKKGMNYVEILEYYFEDVKIEIFNNNTN